MVLAAAVGIAAFVLMCLWPFDGVHPHAWDDVAIAAGLVPQGKMLPGLGVYLSHLTFVMLPYGTALWLNAFLAKALMSVSAALIFVTLKGMLDLSAVAGGAHDLRRRAIAARMAATAAALMFACADPVWQAAQGLTGCGFVAFLVILVSCFFVSFLAHPSFVNASIALVTCGVLCAETPLGWPILAFFVFMTTRYIADNKSQEWLDFLDPVVMQKTKWAMTFLFLGAFLVGVFLEIFVFSMLDGLKAAGSTFAELPAIYAHAYFDSVANAFDITGGCLFFGVTVIPFALAFFTASSSTDEDRFLPFKFSLVHIACGIFAFLQFSPFSFAWFWNIFEGIAVSKVVVLFGVFLSAVTVAWALFIFCVEVLCRDYNRIERILYQHYQEDESGEIEPARKVVDEPSSEKSVKLGFGRIMVLFIPIAMVAVAVYGRRLDDDRSLQRLLCEFIYETIEEAVGTKYLFTDGAFDSWLRIEAKRRGIDLQVVSVMSGTSRRDIYIRQLGTEGFEDRMSLEAGAAEALRTWVVSKSERMSDIAVQVAFEMFRLNRRLDPLVYGLLVRPTGGDAAAAAASILRCHALSDKIVAAHESGIWRHAKDRFLKDRFLFAQFRLAVMSRLRAINLDAQKKVKESIEEIAYSDRLNMNNPSLVKILRRMDWIRRQSGEALTPREGLEVAMKRADFVMARRYAMPVLKEDPDEPNANFAVGMSYYAEEQFAKAEEYLKRVLKKSPNEAAVFNNIALICLKTGRLEEAEANAVQALRLKPDVVEIKDTMRQVEKAKRERTR